MILDFHDELIQLAAFHRRHAILDDLWKTAKDLLYRRRIHIHAADDHHVVGPAENTVLQEDKAVILVAVPNRTDHVASPITNYRRARAAERCQNEMGLFARLRRIARLDGDELGDEFGFVDKHS